MTYLCDFAERPPCLDAPSKTQFHPARTRALVRPISSTRLLSPKTRIAAVKKDQHTLGSNLREGARTSVWLLDEEQDSEHAAADRRLGNDVAKRAGLARQRVEEGTMERRRGAVWAAGNEQVRTARMHQPPGPSSLPSRT